MLDVLRRQLKQTTSGPAPQATALIAKPTLLMIGQINMTDAD